MAPVSPAAVAALSAPVSICSSWRRERPAGAACLSAVLEEQLGAVAHGAERGAAAAAACAAGPGRPAARLHLHHAASSVYRGFCGPRSRHSPSAGRELPRPPNYRALPGVGGRRRAFWDDPVAEKAWRGLAGPGESGPVKRTEGERLWPIRRANRGVGFLALHRMRVERASRGTDGNAHAGAPSRCSSRLTFSPADQLCDHCCLGLRPTAGLRPRPQKVGSPAALREAGLL